MRYFLFVVIAILVAGGIGYAVLQQGGDKSSNNVKQVVSPEPVKTQVVPVDVLVAKRDIAIGEKITNDMVDRQPWPQNLVLAQFIVANDKDPGVEGWVARSSFQAREPLIRSKLANPNDPGFFAAALPGGMRAVSISTNQVDGVFGFVYPGDRVDVLVTHTNPAIEAKNAAQRKQATRDTEYRPFYAQQEKVTEVLVSNVKVLAVNQQSGPSQDGKLPNPAGVTLEASQEDAQKLRLAEKTGVLSLSLRSIKDKDSTDVAPTTEEKNLTRMEGALAPAEETASDASRKITVVRGVRAEKTESRPEAASEAAGASGSKQP